MIIVIKRKIISPLQKAGNRLLRSPVNKEVLNAANAMNDAKKSVTFDKTNMTRVNMNSLKRAFEAKNKLTLARVENSSGPFGLMRTKINPAAMARLKKLKQARVERAKLQKA